MDLSIPFNKQILELHQNRYRFAADHVVPGNILDLACGVGYGSFQMINDIRLNESRCTAVDVSPSAIHYARHHYAHPRIDFVCSGFSDFMPAELFDSIVSLETIEHVPNPRLFVEKMNTLLKPGGVLIISAPVTPSTDGNHYHLSNFSQSSLRKLLNYFELTEIASLVQIQSYSLKQLNPKSADRPVRDVTSLVKFYIYHPGVLYARLVSLLKEGLNNRYLTLVVRKS